MLEEDGTFIFQHVAHPRSSSEDQLRHILDDLCLCLWR